MFAPRSWVFAAAFALAMQGACEWLGAADAILLPDGTSIEHVDFERHVAVLLTRLGCNAGSCHGAQKGQGGFKLSLFAQSPEKDFAAITGGNDPRIDAHVPDGSLLLRKPTLAVDHEGGERLKANSWEYGLLRRWIANGARHTPGAGRVARLRISSAEPRPLSLGESSALSVRAEFADGSAEVVTAMAEIRSHNERVAAVAPLGVVVARGPGATQIIASHRNAFAVLEILVPYANPPRERTHSESQAVNLIDEEIDRRLQELNLATSPPAEDAEFLRRATLDVTGSLPSVDEVRCYLSDRDPAKREKLIARLLADPRRAAWWATRMCDITGCNVNTMESPPAARAKRAKMWHDWFRVRFASNMPYDQMVRGVLCATSRGDEPIESWIDAATDLERRAAEGFESNYHERPDLDLFWRRSGPQGPIPLEDLAELNASAWLGLRMHCARCHHHPFDRWSQRDFAAFASIFAHTHFGSSTELRSAMSARLDHRRQARREGLETTTPPWLRLQEVFVDSTPRDLVDAASALPVVPQPPGGPPLSAEGSPIDAAHPGDMRRQLFEWLTAPENPYFARNFVNRVWARYLGRGLVDPVDALGDGNPPSHPRLLDRLAAEFVASGYDIAHVERIVLSSAAYGRSWRPCGNNGPDGDQYARWPIRPLPAEVLLDAVDAVLETRSDYGPDVPRGTRAIELAPNRFSDQGVDELLLALGRGDRKSLCECDRTTGPSMRQPIHLMTRPDERAAEGRLSRLLRAATPPEEIVLEFYLAALGRTPSEEELGVAREHLARAADPAEALADIVWALINTREFCTNH